MNLEDIMLSEIDQFPKRQILYNSTYFRLSREIIFIVTENKTVVARSWREGRQGS